MTQALIKAFDNDISGCLVETNAELIEIYDQLNGIPDDRRCYIKTQENEPAHFQLSNPSEADLVFTAIDNCVLKSHQQSRCDFLIGNFNKLYFVEVKQTNRGQRRQARTDAIQQLHSSLFLFREKLNLVETELIAVICLKTKQVHPLQSATRGAEMVAFKENHNASLMEGQSSTF